MVREGAGGFAILAGFLLKTGVVFAIIFGKSEVEYCN